MKSLGMEVAEYQEEVIEAAVRAGDKDRLSQLAVSEGGLLSDEVSVTSLSVEM